MFLSVAPFNVIVIRLKNIQTIKVYKIVKLVKSNDEHAIAIFDLRQTVCFVFPLVPV